MNVVDEFKDIMFGDYLVDYKLFVLCDGELVVCIVGLKVLNMWFVVNV